jgi:hypothetical protein
MTRIFPLIGGLLLIAGCGGQGEQTSTFHVT